MGDRTDLPKIKPDKQPSFFNREAGGWGLLGGITASVVGIFAVGGKMFKDMAKLSASNGLTEEAASNLRKKNTPLLLGILGAGYATGIVFGGLKGLDRQKKEQQEGRVVKQPTIWNSGIFSGWLIGALVNIPVNLALQAVKAPNLLIKLTVPATWIGGMVIGSNQRKASMQRDFDQATAQRHEEISGLKQQVRALEQTVAPASYKDSVTPAESAALTAKQDTKQAHADKLTDVPALAEAQRA